MEELHSHSLQVGHRMDVEGFQVSGRSLNSLAAQLRVELLPGRDSFAKYILDCIDPFVFSVPYQGCSRLSIGPDIFKPTNQILRDQGIARVSLYSIRDHPA